MGTEVDLRDCGLVGDGTGDATEAFRRAALQAEGGTILVPAGTFVLSGPVDLGGASIRGQGWQASRIVASADTPPEGWCVGPDTNDVAMLYSINRSGWHAGGFTLDGQDRYTGGLIARGGSDIHFRDVRTVNFANSPIQFMGARREGEEAVRNSSMTRCISEESRWGFVVDGEAHDIVIAGNVSLHAVNRHISLDPREAIEGRKIQTNVLVLENVCAGHRTLPAEWLDDFSMNRFDGAIRAKQGFDGVIARNTIRGWGSSRAEGLARGILCDGDTPVVEGNLVTVERDADKARGIDLGAGIAPGTTVRGNIIRCVDAGIRVHKELIDTALVLHDNHFFDVRVPFSNCPKPRPDQWSIAGNRRQGKTIG